MTETLRPKLRIEFVPTHEFENTPLLLRDNSPNNDWLLNKVQNDPEWREVWGLVHTVVGYNPQKNGSNLPRGCGNSCVSCFFDESYLRTLPQHISDVQEVTPANLNPTLEKFMATSQLRAEERIKKPIANRDKRIRISGDVRGDPVMADYETTKRLVARIKEGFPDIPLFIDTTANQYILTPDQWKNVGADRIMVSIDAVSSEAAYMTFHGVEHGRFENVRQNLKNMDSAGVNTGLSYVWAYHPRLTEEVRNRMPRYVIDSQSEKARKEFIDSLQLSKKPIERFWFFSTGTDQNFDTIIVADKKYKRLLAG